MKEQITCIHPITGKIVEAFKCNVCEEVKPDFMRSRSKGCYCKKCSTKMRKAAPSYAEERVRSIKKKRAFFWFGTK